MKVNEILNLESGLYTADVDGKSAIIGRDKGKGFTIRTECSLKWYEIHHYNEEGAFEGITLDPKDKQ